MKESMRKTHDTPSCERRKIRSAGQMDIAMYHVLMKSCLATKHYATVLELFEEAHQTLARLDSGVYSLAISAAFEANHHSTVVGLSAQAKADEVVLTEESFTRVMEVRFSIQYQYPLTTASSPTSMYSIPLGVSFYGNAP